MGHIQKYAIVTLEKYLDPHTLVEYFTAEEVKVYIDTEGNTVSDQQIARRIGIIDYIRRRQREGLEGEVNSDYAALNKEMGNIMKMPMVEWVMETYETVVTAPIAVKQAVAGKVFTEIAKIAAEQLVTLPGRMTKEELADVTMDFFQKGANRYSKVRKILIENEEIVDYDTAFAVLENHLWGEANDEMARFLGFKVYYEKYLTPKNFIISELWEFFSWGFSETTSAIAISQDAGIKWEKVKRKAEAQLHGEPYEATLYTLKLAGISYKLVSEYEENMARFEKAIAEIREFLKDFLDKVSFLKYYLGAILHSPGEVRILDSQGRIAGLVDGEIKEEIPDSLYDNESGTIVIFLPSDSYCYDVVGIDEGEYGLDVTLGEDGKTTTLSAADIPISSKVTHEYAIDWQSLSQGEEGVAVQIDSDGDGEFEGTIDIPNLSVLRALPVGLESGWNLISSPFQLPDNTIDVVLHSIIPYCSSVWTYEITDTGAEWQRYFKDAPGFLNTLQTIDAGKGYWVRMTDSSILTLDGDEVATDSIMLEPGWNLVGYNSLTARLIEEVLPSLPSACNAIWTYDARGGGWERHVMGGSGNNLEMMEPGKGYWMNAITGCEWNVNSSVLAAPISPPVAAFGSAGASPSHRPGIPYTIWGSIEANGVKMTSGMWPRAPTVVLKIDNEAKARYRLGEVAQYGDYYVLDVPETDKSPQPPLQRGSKGVVTLSQRGSEGIVSLSQRGDQGGILQRGESFGSAQIELYVQFEDTVTKAASVPPGRPGQTMQLDLYVQITPKASLLYQNYPNPFNPDTWIPYQLKEDAHVVIRIYTATGQLVRTLNLGHKPAGFYTDRERAAYWDGKNEAGERVTSGVYFYSIKAGDLTATRKMAITR